MKVFKAKVSQHFSGPCMLKEVLEKMTKMDPIVLKDASKKGAVWLQKQGKGKVLRVREPSQILSPEDSISFFFDPHVLSMKTVTEAECIFENENYGIWFKEAGIVPQGTQTGDHSSLLRYIETQKKKDVYLVHRLDRETQGLMIFAYNSKAAGLLGDLFQKNTIKKIYHAVVLGNMETGSTGSITASLDDKEAISHYEVMSSNNTRSLLQVELETGRLHQIRRHLDHIGHPVMGDPKYGKGNKNREGLKLLAKSLSFTDPWLKKTVHWEANHSLSL